MSIQGIRYLSNSLSLSNMDLDEVKASKDFPFWFHPIVHSSERLMGESNKLNGIFIRTISGNEMDCVDYSINQLISAKSKNVFPEPRKSFSYNVVQYFTACIPCISDYVQSFFRGNFSNLR